MRWKNGCLHKDDFNDLAWAMNVVGNIMMVPHLAGFTDEDGTDYYAFDQLRDWEDIFRAIEILNQLISANKIHEEN